MKLILLLLADRFLRYMDKKIKASEELANQNDNEPPKWAVFLWVMI